LERKVGLINFMAPNLKAKVFPDKTGIIKKRGKVL